MNALLIYYLQALSVIVTISTMTFYFAILMFVTDGKSIYDLPDWFTASISPFGIPFPVIVAAIVLIATAFLLNRLSIGRQIYGLGGNLEGAKRMGCNILGLQCFVYGYSGLTAGIAGLVQAHRVEEVVPNALIGRELDVLAAVVLGGASLQGGIGTVSGAILGIVLLAIVQNGLTLLGVSSTLSGLSLDSSFSSVSAPRLCRQAPAKGPLEMPPEATATATSPSPPAELPLRIACAGSYGHDAWRANVLAVFGFGALAPSFSQETRSALSLFRCPNSESWRSR